MPKVTCLSDQFLDVDTAVAQGAAVLVGFGDVAGERDHAFQPAGYRVLQDLPGQRGGLGRRLADLHAGRLQCFLLGRRGTRGTRHDGTGVAHRLAFRRSESRDVADHRFGHVGLDVVGRPLLGIATDLTDHHDDLCVGILLERLDRVDVRGADHRVTADADGRGKPEIP